MNISGSAVISKDGRYRYRLSRWWGSGKRVVWLMMNPSTAYASEDDATIRKCMGFARTWGYDGIEVINQFAARSRDPKALLTLDNGLLCGPDNGKHIAAAVTGADLVICAWGCESVWKQLRKRGCDHKDALVNIRNTSPEARIECLGKSKSGNPYHPLTLSYSAERRPFA